MNGKTHVKRSRCLKLCFRAISDRTLANLRLAHSELKSAINTSSFLIYEPSLEVVSPSGFYVFDSFAFSLFLFLGHAIFGICATSANDHQILETTRLPGKAVFRIGPNVGS